MILQSHKGMSIPYETTGRTAQKQRTRNDLLAAARELVTAGQTPTVEAAAEAASISRTTAYRYFPNQRALLGAVNPETAMVSLLGETPPTDVVERMNLVATELVDRVLASERGLRAMLRLSLADEPDTQGLSLRQGRRIGWVDDALKPLQGTVPDAELRTLTLAISSVLGIEVLVWLTDIAHCTRQEATTIMRSSAATLLQATLTDAPTPPKTPARPKRGIGKPKKR
jgi:AcrR family transcriptional regulator